MEMETNNTPAIEFQNVSLSRIIRARDLYGISSLYVTKKLDEIPSLAGHRARRDGAGVIIEDATVPGARVIVLDEGRIVFEGKVADFESSSLPAVWRLTHAETETVISGLSGF
jgi:hypothetical protein